MLGGPERAFRNHRMGRPLTPGPLSGRFTSAADVLLQRDKPIQGTKQASLQVTARSLFLGFALCSCGDGSSPSGPPSPTSLSVVMAPGAALIGINGAVRFVVVGHEADGRVVPLDALQLSSLESSIVSLDSSIAIGLTAGIGRIVARNGSASDTALVTVADIVDLTGRDALSGLVHNPMSINNAGLIVGQTFSVRTGPAYGKPFVMNGNWRAIELALPAGSTAGRADGVSDAGVIIGFSGSDFLDAHAVVWTPGNGSTWTVTELPWNGGPTSGAHGISPNGDFIAGQLIVQLSPNNYDARPGIWTRTAANGWVLETLPVADGLGGFAAAVNDSGVVAGGLGYASISQAVVWRKQAGVWVIEKLGMQGIDGESGQAINSTGVEAGQAQGAAVKWTKSSTGWQQQHVFSAQDGIEASYASGINDAGQVVGAFEKDGSQQPFVWKDGGLQKLQALSARGAARAINARGQVAGVSFESNGGTFLGTLWPPR
jgi:probable HAF family extracellular repeat protein